MFLIIELNLFYYQEQGTYHKDTDRNQKNMIEQPIPVVLIKRFQPENEIRSIEIAEEKNHNREEFNTAQFYPKFQTILVNFPYDLLFILSLSLTTYAQPRPLMPS